MERDARHIKSVQSEDRLLSRDEVDARFGIPKRFLELAVARQHRPRVVRIHVGVVAVCGIVEPGSPFAPGVVAEEYWRTATAPQGLNDREVIFQPKELIRSTTIPNASTDELPDHRTTRSDLRTR